jgi:hypothetical protein
VRRAPFADVHYIDALTFRASDVRDDMPLMHETTRFPHCILLCADLAGGDVAVIDLIPVVNEPRHLLVPVGPFRSSTTEHVSLSSPVRRLRDFAFTICQAVLACRAEGNLCVSQ